MPTTRLVASALLVLAAGCTLGDDAPDPKPAPTIDVPQLAMAPFFVPVGESITLTAMVGTADGSPIGDYEFHWNGIWTDDGSQMKVEESHPSHGVEVVTLTPQIPGRFDVNALVLANEQGSFTLYEPVIAWGGTPVDVKPFELAVSLVVGEQRPVAGFPGAHTLSNQNLYTVGKDPVQLATGNTAIARITADGLVEGIAAGTTTLELSSGGTHATIPLTVTTGALGLPADGIASIDGLAVDAVRPRDGAFFKPADEDRPEQLEVDSHGAPLGVLRAAPYVSSPLLLFYQNMALLTRWTGSGMGTEWISEPWDDIFDARMTVDSTDAPWAVYFSKTFRDIEVATRPANGGPASWTHRHLPMDLDMAKAAGLHALQYTFPLDTDRAAILPRAGGGVWVAYATIDDFRFQDPEIYLTQNLDTPGTCAEVIKLAEITPTTINVQEVLVRWYDVTLDPRDTCRIYRNQGLPIQLLPPAPGGTIPRVLSTVDLDAEIFEAQAGTWTDTVLGHPLINDSGNATKAFVVVALPDHAGDATVLMSDDTRTTTPVPSGLRWTELGASSGMGERSSNYYAFQAQGRLYAGAAFAGPLSVQTAYGGYVEDPSGAWKPGAYDPDWGDSFPLTGYAHHGQRLHMLSSTSTGSPLLLSRQIPKADPTPTDPETSGTRLGAGPLTPLASSSPVIATDGSRYVLTDTRFDATGALLRSAGPGQPFTVKATRDAATPLAAATQLSVVGTDIVFARHTTTALEVYRSIDLGETFTMTSTTVTTTPLEASVATPAGAVFAMLWDPNSIFAFQVGFATTPAVAMTLSAGLTGADVSTLIISSGTLFPTSNGAVLVVHALLNDGTAMHPRILVRRYDNTGTQVVQFIVDPQLNQGEYEYANGCSLAPNAVVCVSQRSSRRIDLTTGVVTFAALPDKNLQERPPGPITLSDGRLLLPVVRADVPHAYRAGYRLSTDGVTWGAFTALRPDGGDGQSIYGLAAESNAHALFMVGDSGLMMAGDGKTTPQVVVQAAAIP